MTQHPEDRQPSEQGQGSGRGEVVISGLDTGPDEAARENLTPTEDHARFLPPEEREPEDEDG